MKNTYVLTHDGELYHYGVPGMKWGVRRKLDAIRGSSSLNKLDRRKAEETASYIRADIKSRSYASKISKAKNAVAAAKLKSKKAEVDARRKQHLKNAQNIQAETDRMISKMKKNGFTVSSKETIRYTKTGERAAVAYLSGIIGHATLTSVKESQAGDRYKAKYNGRNFNQNEYAVKGTDYRVG